MNIVLISLDLLVILNTSGIKYHFVVRFHIGHEDNKGKDIQVCLIA